MISSFIYKLLQTAIQLLSIGIIFFSLPFFIDKVSYGLFGYFFSISTLFHIISDFGISKLMYRKISSKIFQQGEITGGFLFVSLSILPIALLLSIFNIFKVSSFIIFTIIFVWILNVQSVADSVLKGFGEFKLLMIIELISRSILIVGLFILIKYWHRNIHTFILSFISLSAIFPAICISVIYTKYTSIRKISFFKANLKEIIFVEGASLFHYLFTKAEYLLIYFFISPVALAEYQLPYRLVRLAEYLPFAAGVVVARAVAISCEKKEVGKLKELILKPFWFCLIAGGVLTLIFILLISPFLKYVFKDYAVSSKILSFISIYLPFRLPVVFITSGILIAMKKQKDLFLFTGLGGILNLLFGSFLISYYGISGMALSKLITHAVLFLLVVYSLKKYLIKKAGLQN